MGNEKSLILVANEEAKKRVAEMEMAEVEKRMAKTDLNSGGGNSKDMAT